MLVDAGHMLHGHPALALFLSIALGYLLGRVPFGGIRIGGICGTVLVALVIGQSGVGVPPGAAGLSFLLFVYSLGYLGGPSFLSSLNRRTLILLIFPTLQIVVAVAMVMAVAHVSGMNVATAMGLMTGASSQSAALGAASQGLPVSDGPALTTSFAVAYLVSILTTVIFVSQILPIILRLSSTRTSSDDQPRALPPDVVGRAFVVRGCGTQPLSRLQNILGDRIVVADVLRRSATALRDQVTDGDVVRLIGARHELAMAGKTLGPEIPMPPEFVVNVRTVDVVVSRPHAGSATLGDVRGGAVVVLGLLRQNEELTLDDDVVLRPGDVMTLAGAASELSEQVDSLGVVETRRTTQTSHS